MANTEQCAHCRGTGSCSCSGCVIKCGAKPNSEGGFPFGKWNPTVICGPCGGKGWHKVE